jgi:acetyl-CoA synthetase
MKPFSDAQTKKLNEQFPNYVTVSNPFDYNTSIWGDRAAQEKCFTTSMEGDHDAALLIYDHPTVISNEVGEWLTTIDAFIAAHKTTGMPAFVVCTISELLPEDLRERLISEGVVPLQGLDDALFALSAAAKYYQKFLNNGANETTAPNLTAKAIARDSAISWSDERQSKRLLQDAGLTVPEGDVGSAAEAVKIAERIGFPVVVKAVGVLHKSDVGAVILNLQNADEVKNAVAKISESIGESDQYLVERLTTGTVAELIIGVNRDDQFGPALVIGAGGILVELVADSVSLLLPTDRNAVSRAIESLSVAKLIKGFRGNKPGDMEAAVDAILSIAKFAESKRDSLMELDVNPLLVLPAGQGVVVADALIGFSSEDSS